MPQLSTFPSNLLRRDIDVVENSSLATALPHTARFSIVGKSFLLVGDVQARAPECLPYPSFSLPD